MSWFLYLCDGTNDWHHLVADIKGTPPGVGEVIYYAGEHHVVKHRHFSVHGAPPEMRSEVHVYAEVRR